MNFCTKLQKNPEMLAWFAKKLYLCIRNKRKKAVFNTTSDSEHWKEVWVSG